MVCQAWKAAGGVCGRVRVLVGEERRVRRRGRVRSVMQVGGEGGRGGGGGREKMRGGRTRGWGRGSRPGGDEEEGGVLRGSFGEKMLGERGVAGAVSQSISLSGGEGTATAKGTRTGTAAREATAACACGYRAFRLADIDNTGGAGGDIAVDVLGPGVEPERMMTENEPVPAIVVERRAERRGERRDMVWDKRVREVTEVSW